MGIDNIKIHEPIHDDANNYNPCIDPKSYIDNRKERDENDVHILSFLSYRFISTYSSWEGFSIVIYPTLLGVA